MSGIGKSPLRQMLDDFEAAVQRRDYAGALDAVSVIYEGRRQWGRQDEISGTELADQIGAGKWPTDAHLADAIRMAVFDGSRMHPAVMLFVADVIERKADRRGKPGKRPADRRSEDILLIERLEQLKREFAGAHAPAAAAYDKLAEENGWADQGTARKYCQRARTRIGAKGGHK